MFIISRRLQKRVLLSGFCFLNHTILCSSRRNKCIGLRPPRLRQWGPIVTLPARLVTCAVGVTGASGLVSSSPSGNSNYDSLVRSRQRCQVTREQTIAIRLATRCEYLGRPRRCAVISTSGLGRMSDTLVVERLLARLSTQGRGHPWRLSRSSYV